MLSCLLLAGCAESRAYRIAHQTEERSEPHVAYEQYCKAAAEYRSSGAIAGGLARVRPGASAYWESQALLAQDNGRIVDAWRMLMKALEIEPDSRTTPRLIRQLEAEHSTALAQARIEWIQTGTLAIARLPTILPEPDAESISTPRSRTRSSREKASRKREPEVFREERLDDRTGETPEEARIPVAPPTRTEPAKPSRPPLRGDDNQFLIVQSLSLKDRAYPRTCVMVDGIEVRLRDTDDDLEADLDLYAGRTRIKKIREIKIGHSQVFAGTSGRMYRLTVLGIHHQSRTVRIGIRRA